MLLNSQTKYRQLPAKAFEVGSEIFNNNNNTFIPLYQYQYAVVDQGVKLLLSKAFARQQNHPSGESNTPEMND